MGEILRALLVPWGGDTGRDNALTEDSIVMPMSTPSCTYSENTSRVIVRPWPEASTVPHTPAEHGARAERGKQYKYV